MDCAGVGWKWECACMWGMACLLLNCPHDNLVSTSLDSTPSVTFCSVLQR